MRQRVASIRARMGIIVEGWAVACVVQSSPVGTSVGVPPVCAPQSAACKGVGSQGCREGAIGTEHASTAEDCVTLQALTLCGPGSRAAMSRDARA